VNRAGIHVDDTVFEALACADSVLQTDERELGVCLVDIGAGSTDLIVYYEGVVIHTGAIPIGGDHFTNDIGVGFRTPLPDAESIKKMFGCAIVTRIPEGNEIEVPSVGDRPARMMQQRMLGEILEPRGRELMEMLRDHLRHSGMDELLGAGLVFTGGGSRLNGLLEVAEDILRRPVRQGYPVPIAKLPSELLEPEFGTAIGMVLYGHRSRQARMNLDRSLGARIRALFAKQGV
jgi:cell division protein FtsA